MNFIAKYRLALLFLLLGAGCLVTYNVIGSHVDEAGILREPFALVPMTWIFLLLGVITFFVTRFRKRSV